MSLKDVDLTTGDVVASSDVRLSEAGRARCREMLGLLQKEAVRCGGIRRARRIAYRGFIGTCGIVFLLVAAAYAFRYSKRPVLVADRAVPQEKVGETSIEILQTKPGAWERYAALPRADIDKYVVDDVQIVSSLEQIGRPTGLIRVGQTVRLTAAVTDVELGVDPGTPDGAGRFRPPSERIRTTPLK